MADRIGYLYVNDFDRTRLEKAISKIGGLNPASRTTGSWAGDNDVIQFFANPDMLKVLCYLGDKIIDNIAGLALGGAIHAAYAKWKHKQGASQAPGLAEAGIPNPDEFEDALNELLNELNERSDAGFHVSYSFPMMDINDYQRDASRPLRHSFAQPYITKLQFIEETRLMAMVSERVEKFFGLYQKDFPDVPMLGTVTSKPFECNYHLSSSTGQAALKITISENGDLIEQIAVSNFVNGPPE